ncbi:MAG: aryl-sulfate sulfotransferase [Chloroflexi bacterium]|nr:aryl-sulfate sulfotransferase [Chloroflexota bacterium]
MTSGLVRRLAAVSLLVLLQGALVQTAWAQATDAPDITSLGPFEVDEGTTAVATLTADDDDTTSDNLTWTKTGGADGASFTLSTAGVLAFVAAKDYEVPDDADSDGSYEVTVQVSDGTDTDSAELVVTLANVIELTDISGPASASIGENSFARVGTYSASSDADRSGITWSLSGTDAADFSIDSPPGALRFEIAPVTPNLFNQAPDYEDPDDSGTDNVYNVTVTASVTGGGSKTLAVTVTVTNVDEDGEITLSATQPRVGTALTARLSDPDGVTAGTATWQWERNNGRDGWLAIAGATTATYTPTAADGDRYLRVRATYTDGLGAGKSAEATAKRVVIARRLSALRTAGHDSARPLYPTFDPDTLHYGVGCTNGSLTLTMTSEEADTRLAVNGIHQAGQTASVDVRDLHAEDERGDIRITLSGPDGGETSYVVHCLPADAPRIGASASTGATDDLLLFSAQSSRGFLLVIDSNGVPRFRRAVPFTVGHFRTHPDGAFPFSYAIRWRIILIYRPVAWYSSQFVLLDRDLREVKTVRHVSPLQHTTPHDFLVFEDGGYALLSYNPARRDLSAFSDSMGNPYSSSEGTEDSIIQRVGVNGRERFRWNSWDHMAIEDCTQHRFPADYAHINTIEDVDGNYLASLRGCSQVVLIDGDSGDPIWRLGRSNRNVQDWITGGGVAPAPILGDPYGEFCGQHSATMLENGHLILFDNGGHCVVDLETRTSQRTDGVFSRVVEYSLDKNARSDEVEYALYRRQHSLHGEFDRYAQSQGHVEPMSNGHWLISWGNGFHDDDPSTPLPPDVAITQVDPATGAELLSVTVRPHNGERSLPVRAYPLSPVALAPKIEDLKAEVVAHSGFHAGASATERPSVIVAFNRPVVDPTASTTSIAVRGASVTSVSAYRQAGAPANAYQFTLTPRGNGAITFTLRTGQACASGGICTADGTTLSEVPAALQIRGPATVAFGSAAYRVSEGGSVNVQVRLSAAHQSPRAVVIPLAVGTASTAAADEYSYTASASFARGETVKTVTLRAGNDALVEGDESVVLEFGSLPTGVSAGSQATTTVTLNDTDRATISFSVGQSQVAEGGSTELTFAITNGVTFQADQEIALAVSGSASVDDYALSERVTLPGGQTSASTSLSVTDDAALETAETVAIRATIGAASTLIGTRTVTIPPSDVPNVPRVGIAPGADAAEGAAATFTLTRTVSTSLPLASPLAVAIQVSVTDVQLSGAAQNRVTFAAGEATAELSIGTRDDTLISDAGAVSVLVAASTTNPPAYLVDTDNSASITIIDNDTPAFRISPETADLAESRSLTVTVQTDGVTFATPQTITATLGGTATEGVDFELLDQQGDAGSAPLDLTLAARATSVRLRVNGLRDSEDDAGETVVVSFAHDGATIGAVTLTLTETPPPPPVSSFAGGSLGGGGGGGGGGGPNGPTPSAVDFEWTVKHDIEELDPGHGTPTGMWSDGTTLWLLQNGATANDAVYAYVLGTGERAGEREFALDQRNRAPRGIWSDGETVWISDSGRDRLFAHELASGERLPDRDLALASRNADARGIWSDGKTVWVLDGGKDSLFAYDLETGDPLGEYGLDSANSDPHGIWSDGVGVWVSNHDPKRLLAYRLPAPPGGDEPGDGDRALERVRDEDFTQLSGASNNSPRGVWSDGAVMYVADQLDGKIYTYNMPDAIDARLATLTLSGVDIGEFDPATNAYEGVVAENVTETTVEAVAAQRGATVVVEPLDAGGHQVTLARVKEVTVTVFSADGSRMRVYRVTLPAPAEEGACLRGAVAEGFSLVVYKGGSLDELVACAEERHVTALYVLHEGEWVSYIPGAPDSVNEGFRALYAGGVPALTPLAVASEGPATAAAAARDVDTAAWAACLLGELGDGFSLVAYEGGSVAELAACAEEQEVAALYALHEGQWVAYIPSAPSFANAAFEDLFAGGVPPATPLAATTRRRPSSSTCWPPRQDRLHRCRQWRVRRRRQRYRCNGPLA